MKAWLIVLFVCSVAIAAPPASQPSRPGYRLVDGQWIAVGKIDSWQQLLTLELSDGQLVAALSPDKSLAPRLASGRRIATTIGDSPLVWVMSFSRFSGIDAAKRGSYLRSVGLPPAGAPEGSDRFRLCGVLIEPNAIVLRGEGMMNDHRMTCELHQDSSRKFLTLRITDQPTNGQPRAMEAKAVDFRMLLLEHGDAMRLYVAPLLDELSGEAILRPRAADVYRIFRDISATPEGNAKLAPILNELSDRDPAIRRKAESKLDDAGDEVMLAVLRVNQSKLNSPQQGALQRFVERHQLILDSQIERTREDLAFLIDCLDFDDRAVRAKAKAGIERYTDEKITFDLDLEGSKRSEAVEQLRLLYTHPLD